MLKPSTLPKPLLVFAVVLLLAIAALGAGAAFAGGGAPHSFGTPAPHYGDQGIYSVTVVQASGETYEVVEPETEFLQFEWIGPGYRYDGDGNKHATHAVRIFSPEWYFYHSNGTKVTEGIDHILHLDRGSMALVAEERINAGGGPGAETRVETWYRAQDDDRRFECGLVHSLQGAKQTIRWGTPLLPACISPAFAGGEDVYRPRGTETLGSFETVILRGYNTVVWLSDANPYPIRMVFQDQQHNDRLHVMQLTSFSRGASPLAQPEALEAEPAPTIDLAPAVDGLPHETGFPGTLTLKEALDAARDHPDMPVTRQWLSDHPNAFVYGARSHTSTYLDDRGEAYHRHRHIWQISMTDGKESFDFFMEREDGPVEGNSVGPVRLVPVPDERSSTITGQDGEVRCSQECLVPASPPANLATYASVAAVWEAHRTDEYADLDATSWGFRLDCWTPSCEEPQLNVEGGVNHNVRSADGPLRHWRSEFDTRGRSLELVEVFAERRDIPNDVERVDTASASGFAPRTLESGTWTALSTKQVMSAGFFSLAVAGLYGLWPGLKVLLMFSSVTSRVAFPLVKRNREARQIYAYLQENPHSTPTQVATALDLTREKTHYYLFRLYRVGLIMMQPAKDTVSCEAAGIATHWLTVFAWSSPHLRRWRVLRAFKNASVRTFGEVERAARIGADDLRPLLEELQDAGLLEFNKPRATWSATGVGKRMATARRR